jgi:predicted anti-sigma-YlaC factor YlaD
MTCSEFVESFSDVRDGTASPEVVLAAEAHLASCASCRRYRHVLERGSELLRALPAPEVGEDFVPRLQHRLLREEQEAFLRRHANSGATALVVVGMALVLTFVAWAPALRRSAPVVELPPIVVSTPPRPPRAPVSFTAFAVQATAAAAARPSDLWGDARTLLFQYSRLARRNGESSPSGSSGAAPGR